MIFGAVLFSPDVIALELLLEISFDFGNTVEELCVKVDIMVNKLLIPVLTVGSTLLLLLLEVAVVIAALTVFDPEVTLFDTPADIILDNVLVDGLSLTRVVVKPLVNTLLRFKMLGTVEVVSVGVLVVVLAGTCFEVVVELEAAMVKFKVALEFNRLPTVVLKVVVCTLFIVVPAVVDLYGEDVAALLKVSCILMFALIVSEPDATGFGVVELPKNVLITEPTTGIFAMTFIIFSNNPRFVTAVVVLTKSRLFVLSCS